MSASTMLEHALAYAAAGRYVFPLHTPHFDGTGQIVGCSCGNPMCSDIGKHPRTLNGVYDATTDQSQIIAWWSQWPDANIGCHCGASGLFVLDCDAYASDYAGDDFLSVAEKQTITSLTGGGGEHLLYRMPTGMRLGNGIGSLPSGIHVRGWGGYIVLPPSLHRSGKPYVWEHGFSPGEMEPAPLPAKVVQLLTDNWDTETNAATVEFRDVGEVPLCEFNLPPDIVYAIHHPARVGQRSEVDQSVVWWLLNNGATADEIRAIFRKYPIGTRGKYASKRRHADAYLQRCIQNARHFQPRKLSEATYRDQETGTDMSVGELIRFLKALVMTHPYNGRNAAEQMAVAVAAVEVWMMAQRIEAEMSCRYIADRTGLGHTTVHRILCGHRHNDGSRTPSPLTWLLTIERRSDGNSANVYRVSDAVLRTFRFRADNRRDNGTNIGTILAPYSTTHGADSTDFTARYRSPPPPYHRVSTEAEEGVSSFVPDTHLFSDAVFDFFNVFGMYLRDDAFMRNYVPQNRRSTPQRDAGVWVKAFTPKGRVLVALLAAYGDLPLSEVATTLGFRQVRPVTDLIHRMSASLAIVGVAPIVHLEPDPNDKRRKIVCLDPDWRANLYEARPHLYTSGLRENRIVRHATERKKRFETIRANTRDAGVVEMCDWRIAKADKILARSPYASFQ